MILTITKKIYRNGVLFDPDGGVVLSDPTGAFGVKRLDLGESVVPDSTAMDRVGTGLYTYSFSEPVTGLTYEYWVEFTAEGITQHIEGTLTGSTGYDPSTPAGRVRLLIADTQAEVFSDAEIAAFLAMESDIVYNAAALALESLASDASRRAKAQSSGQFSTSFTTIPGDLRACARVFRDTYTNTPAWAESAAYIHPWDSGYETEEEA